jgi:hypothetical protein
LHPLFAFCNFLVLIEKVTLFSVREELNQWNLCNRVEFVQFFIVSPSGHPTFRMIVHTS